MIMGKGPKRRLVKAARKEINLAHNALLSNVRLVILGVMGVLIAAACILA